MKRIPVKQYLAIDIGGTSAKCAHISGSGKILQRRSFATGLSLPREAFLEALYHISDGAVNSGVHGIGICSPGIVNPHTGQILGGVQNLPYLNGMNLRERMGERYPGLPVHVGNDVKAVARGEQWVGAARGCASFACIALGTGLGGALVIDGKLVEGAHFRAGEIGYMNYRGDDEYLEKQTSTKFVMEDAALALDLPEIDGFAFFRMLREGNATCLAVLRRWAEKIACLIANLIVILDLEKVIVGGGISREKDILIPLVKEAVDRKLPPEFRGQTAIEAARLANDAGMLGAVSALAAGQASPSIGRS